MERIYSVVLAVEVKGETFEKKYIGTEKEVYEEAHDWMYRTCLEYINVHGIRNIEEQVAVFTNASHSIEWGDLLGVMGFIVRDEDESLAIYTSRADAEEAILAECEYWAEQILMTEDSRDVMGRDEWYYPADYKYLMNAAADCFFIEEVPYLLGDK